MVSTLSPISTTLQSVCAVFVFLCCFFSLVEQKLRDKLAAAMREKMTQVTSNTREKSLQAERKRRAAMFVNMLKNKKATSSDNDSVIGKS